MSDFNTSLIGLKDDEVEYCKEVISRSGGVIMHTVFVRLVNRGHICPNCSTYTRRIKEYRTRSIDHAIFLNEKCVIKYSARRFICPKCNSTFYEDNPFTSQYRTPSDKTVENVMVLLKQTNQTYASVARAVNLSKSEVIKIFDEHGQQERNQLSECIGIDEFYFSRKATHKFALMILSLNKGYIIDLRNNREKAKLISYFRSIPKEERDRVRYISIDLSENFRSASHICFPAAKVCADPFHVIKLLSKCLDDVRLRTLHLYSDNKKSDQYYLLKYRKDLLYSEVEFDDWKKVSANHHFRMKLSDKRLQEMILDISKELNDAWHLKERYRSFNDSDMSSEERSELLDILIDSFISSQIPEMMSFGLTIDNWKEEILNSFITITKRITRSNGTKETITARVTNGPVEGRNKYIKQILSLANGYANFDRFRNRAMYSLNKKQGYSADKQENTVRRKKTNNISSV